MNVSPTIWDYSQSNINETLLLESYEGTQKDTKPLHKRPSLLDELKQKDVNASRQKSFMFDLYEELSITVSNSNLCLNGHDEQPQQKIQDLYNICSNLMTTIEKLQSKVTKMEEKEHLKDTNDKKTNDSTSEKEAQSILSYSNLQNSKTCKCQNNPNQKEFMLNFLEALQSRSKLQVYKQQNDELKKKIIRLQITNEQLKKATKKAQTQNLKLRELLKQYQIFNKKQLNEKQHDQAKLERNLSNKILSERKYTHKKKNPSNLDPNANTNPSGQYGYEVYYQNETDYANKFSDLNSYNPNHFGKRQNEQYLKPEKQKDSMKSREACSFAQLQRKNNFKSISQEMNTNVTSFEQCRRNDPLNSFIDSNGTNVTSRISTLTVPYDKNQLTFCGLKQNMKYSNYSSKQNLSPLRYDILKGKSRN